MMDEDQSENTERGQTEDQKKKPRERSENGGKVSEVKEKEREKKSRKWSFQSFWPAVWDFWVSATPPSFLELPISIISFFSSKLCLQTLPLPFLLL